MMLLAVYAVALAYLGLAAVITFAHPERYLKRLAWVNLGAATIALMLAGLTSGIYFNYDGYFGDFWTATDAMNKAQDGLLSSVDFFSPIGPVYYHFYTVIAFLDSTLTASTIMHASALAALVAGVLSVVILHRQMSFLGLSLVLISVVTVAVSGRGNGELLHDMPMHFLAPYNRWGWAFFIPVAVSLALPLQRNRAGDVAIGLTIALLLMLKVTYGAALLGLVAARVALVPGSWRQLPFIAGGVVATLAVLELATGQVTAHLRDLALTASFPQSGLRVGKLFDQLGEMGLFSLLGIVAYLATVEQLPERPITLKKLWAFCRPILLILLVAGAGCAVLMQNHYQVEAAAYPLLMLIALEWTGALRPNRSILTQSDFRSRILLTAATLLVAFYPIVDLGMHVGQRLQYQINGPDPAFAGTPYADLRFEPYLIEQEDSLLNTVSDGHAGVLSGRELLLEAGADQDGAGRIATLSFANPFPMLFDQPAPAGTPIWLHENRSFSRDVFVDPETFFTDVDFVLIPPGPSALEDIYSTTLEMRFEEHSRSRYWVLFTRREG